MPQSLNSLHTESVQLLVDAVAALVVLAAVAALSVFKPRGLTPYGWRLAQPGRAR